MTPWAAEQGVLRFAAHQEEATEPMLEMDAPPTAAPGRSCPLHYRYRPEVFAVDAPSDLDGLDVLYVVGGLYGNAHALARVLELFERERGRKRLVLNGDFHWFDVDRGVFAAVQRAVVAHRAIRGNVETELASENTDDDAGCGCAYPDWVGDGVVERSNRILHRLRRAATVEQRAALSALPMWLRANVGSARFGIVHGDATSLAGWGFAQEHLADAAHRAEVAQWIARGAVDAYLCTHTCLPVFQAIRVPSTGTRPETGPEATGWVLNNGAAGMPNFRGDPAGLFTRVALTPWSSDFEEAERRFGVAIGPDVFAEAIAIGIDDDAWRRDFVSMWPAGSDAHLSYHDRIAHGPDYSIADAVRTESA